MTTAFTIGHSTRNVAEFIGILKRFGIDQLVDVRTIPRSRFNPQFNKATFSKKLRSHGIGYHHLKGLGGLRHAVKGSANTGWKNASFRGYADHMQTPEFEAGLNKLIKIAKKKQIVIMCAEALPWRCHRSLIADALTVRGIKVDHIFSTTNSQQHELTSFAKVCGRKITYPG